MHVQSRAPGAGMHVHTERLALNTYIHICMCGGAERGGAERMCIYRATGAGMHVHEERLALETYICMCRAERLALACMCIQSAWR